LFDTDTIGQFNVLVKGQEEEINRLKVSWLTLLQMCFVRLLPSSVSWFIFLNGFQVMLGYYCTTLYIWEAPSSRINHKGAGLIPASGKSSLPG